MYSIGKNEELRQFFFKNDRFIRMMDSRLIRMDMVLEDPARDIYEPRVDLYFTTLKKEKLMVRCTGVTESLFYYKIGYPGWIERQKFFKQGDMYYISLDPYNEEETMLDEDQDTILAKDVEGFLEW